VTLANGATHTLVVVSDQAGTNSHLVALDAHTGSFLWVSRLLENEGIYYFFNHSSSDHRLVVGGGSSVVELNAATGIKIWSQPTHASVSGLAGARSPGPSGQPSAIIATDTAGNLYSLNPVTGKINWGDRQPGPVGGPPAVANGVIYLATAASPGAPAMLEAVNANTGHGILQADELNPQPYPPGPPSIGDGRVFVGDFDGGFAVFTLPS
jgi:outer membrane protein assembly factor BamB